MNQPKTPDDLPQSGPRPATDPIDQSPTGIPDGTEDGEPKARPTSDRADTETATQRIEKSS